MKKLFVLFTLLITFSQLNAQEKEKNYFTEVIKGDKGEVFLLINFEEDHILEFPNKIAMDLWAKVEMAAADYWVNPDGVIVGKLEGKYIKIIGHGSEIKKSSPFRTDYHKTLLSLTFKFKDGKMLYNINSVKERIPIPVYNSGDHDYVPQVTKTNGKRTEFGRENINIINKDINDFIKLVITSCNADDDEW